MCEGGRVVGKSYARQPVNLGTWEPKLFGYTGKGVLSEHEHFPSGAFGQSSLKYKCAYFNMYMLGNHPWIMIQLKYSYKFVVFWPSHMDIVTKVVQCLGGGGG